MTKLIQLFSVTTFYLVTFILLSSLFVFENVFSPNKWDRTFVNVYYNPAESSISIQFVVFNYHFLAKNYMRKHAYLQWCNFYFTIDEESYTRLMRAETLDQEECDITRLMMRCRLVNADLQFLGCIQPADASRWVEYHKYKEILVKNITNYVDGSTYAIFTVKWFPGEIYKDVKRIRLHGSWFVNGFGYDQFKDVDYDNLSRSMLKSEVNQTENTLVKVTAKADAIVITGAENGENIKVYNTVGVEVQSSDSKSDEVNIVLPKNQIYFVNIGQTRYKVAM